MRLTSQIPLSRIWFVAIALVRFMLLPAGVHAELEVPPQPNTIAPTLAKPITNTVTFLNVTAPERTEVDGIVVIQGLVFEDINSNGSRDSGEVALKGVSIGVQTTGQGEDTVPVLATTNEQGLFSISAPANAVISIIEPDGFRSVGPTSRFAKPDMVFGLRPMQTVVERVMPAPVVNVQPSGLDLKTAWPFLLVVILGLGALGWLITRGLNRQTQAQAELADWRMQRALTVPGSSAPLRQVASYPAESDASEQLPLLASTGEAKSSTSLAVVKSNLHLMPIAIGDPDARNIDPFGRPAPGLLFCNEWEEANWFALAEQAIADALRESVKIDGFLGMMPLPNAWMRFSTKDGRIFTFTVSRTGVEGCRWWTAQKIDPMVTGRSFADLRMLYQRYADAAGLPSSLPRNCGWYVFSERGFVVLHEDATFSRVGR